MKLCPLFQSIELHWCDARAARESYLCNETLVAANKALPRESIAAAIALMIQEANFALTPPLQSEYRNHIEQLRAML
jgi:hypothetical protein